ncbi:hypothetical protein CCHOA_08830 [Corynebacterium choanae]|uniref:Uncharacterized protein n=1 Tax=Corynebacterium choanae TaxID=1862358 RepID=A0A3G6J8Q2_9CORY|nr:hypothetical protein CCHOA_08830 [Corynebacterium choanae]
MVLHEVVVCIIAEVLDVGLQVAPQLSTFGDARMAAERSGNLLFLAISGVLHARVCFDLCTVTPGSLV